jgi:hypothetical protein
MYQEFYRGMQLVSLPLFALIVFFTTFVVVLGSALFRRSDQAAVDAKARLPLGTDDGGRS